MEQRFEFTPSVAENRAALAAISRSMAKQVSQTGRQLLACLALYGLPLIFAAIFFRQSFEEIYITFALFVVGAVFYSRISGGMLPAIAENYAVPQSVNLTPEDIEQETGRAFVRWPLSTLNRLHALDDVLVLEFSDWSWVPLPNRLWSSAEARQIFVNDLRTAVPGLLPDFPSASVPSPFSPINVAAGFGAAAFFLLEIGVFVRVVAKCERPTLFGLDQASTFGLLFAATLGGAVGSFFVIRYALRKLNNRNPRVVKVFANILIWMVVLALVACLFSIS